MLQNVIYSILLFALSLILISSDQAKATTVIKLDFDQVCQGAELIFEGKAISEETRSSPESGRPFVYITFNVTDVIKGTYSGQTIELGFMGGQLGGIVLEIPGMHVPEVGERGIYFVENLSEQLVQPLCGWQQGHYLVVPDKQTGQDTVIPLKEKGSFASAYSMSSSETVTLADFKQKVRYAVGWGR